jgi:hypothetical protein
MSQRSPVTFADYARQTTPDFLQELVGYCVGVAAAFDELRNRVRRGQKNVYLHTADPVSYDAHGWNSNMPRVRGESDLSLIAALNRRWEAWEQSGAEQEMLIQLGRLGYANPLVVTYSKLWDAGRTGAFGGPTGFPSFWFLVLPWPIPRLIQMTVRWGDGSKWGQVPRGPMWGGGGLVPQDIEAVRQVIFKWKPAHTSCRFILCALGPSFKLNPDYTWSGAAITYPVNEWWEFDGRGRVRPFYNQSPDKP